MLIGVKINQPGQFLTIQIFRGFRLEEDILKLDSHCKVKLFTVYHTFVKVVGFTKCRAKFRLWWGLITPLCKNLANATNKETNPSFGA